MKLEETAEAIVCIAVSGMYLEVSKLVSSYGIDPRDNALLAFGGAGPMTACFLAEELGIRQVVVPTAPGVLSALGGLIADLKNDFVKTVYLELEDETLSTIRSGFEELQAQGETWLRSEQGYQGELTFIHSADMRYRGQSFELEAILDQAAIEGGDMGSLAESFHAVHEQIYSHADREAPVQMINLRLVAVGQNTKPGFERGVVRERLAEPVEQISVYTGGEHQRVSLYHRERLLPGDRLEGPAVVAQDDTTVCILEGFSGRVDAYRHLVLTRD